MIKINQIIGYKPHPTTTIPPTQPPPSPWPPPPQTTEQLPKPNYHLIPTAANAIATTSSNLKLTKRNRKRTPKVGIITLPPPPPIHNLKLTKETETKSRDYLTTISLPPPIQPHKQKQKGKSDPYLIAQIETETKTKKPAPSYRHTTTTTSQSEIVTETKTLIEHGIWISVVQRCGFSMLGNERGAVRHAVKIESLTQFLWNCGSERTARSIEPEKDDLARQYEPHTESPEVAVPWRVVMCGVAWLGFTTKSTALGCCLWWRRSTFEGEMRKWSDLEKA